jgi:hypothetical protein
MLPKITETILHAKSTKGLTFAGLAKVVGCHPVFLAAVCYRQASATREQAEKLLEALGLDPAWLPDLTGFPVKGGLMPTNRPGMTCPHEVQRLPVIRYAVIRCPSRPTTLVPQPGQEVLCRPGSTTLPVQTNFNPAARAIPPPFRERVGIAPGLSSAG